MIKSSVVITNNIDLKRTSKVIDLHIRKVLSSRTQALKADIVAAWPVKSGRSKAGWRIQANQYSWSVVNSVSNPETGEEYVDDLWKGLPWGSSQMPLGGDPIVRKHSILFIRDLKAGGLK